MRARALLSVALLLMSGVARAAGVSVDAAWARASTGEVGAAYVTLSGHGTGARLTGIRTPAAGMAMLHESRTENGVSIMRDVDAFDVPAHGAVAMRPGGVHVMLTGLRAPLRAGDRLPLTLDFADGSHLTVMARVGGPGAIAPP